MTFNNDFAFNNYLAARVRVVAKKHHSDNVWATRDAIAAEIRPPTDKLDDLNIEETVLTRMANRRKTDTRVNNGRENNNSFFHPSVGLPEAGIRMVSVAKRAQDEEDRADESEENGVENSSN